MPNPSVLAREEQFEPEPAPLAEAIPEPQGPFAVIPNASLTDGPRDYATGPFEDSNDALIFASALPDPGMWRIVTLRPAPSTIAQGLWLAPDATPTEGPNAPHACPLEPGGPLCTCSPEQERDCAASV